MIRTSRMSGTSMSVVVPSVRSDAAMSFRTLFLAPGTRTAPSRRAPPTIRNASTGVDGTAPLSRCPPAAPPLGSALVVNLTRIYTRTGDDGTTSLGDFSRTSKTDSRLVAYADTNEANAQIGGAVAVGDGGEEVTATLTRVQNELFDVGADLCNPLQATYESP